MSLHSTRTTRHSPSAHRPLADRHPLLDRGIPFLFLVIFMAGCSKMSFLSKRYDNFTAYYNTFYNAARAFESGTKALERPDEKIDRNLYLSIFTSPGQASNSQDFEDTILKSADVLRKHPNSKWVDDALLLIGKSYFYQQNYVGAEQKFNEVIDLGSALEDEARFWLARSLIASGRYDEASEHLELSLNREGLSARWKPMLRLAVGELYVKRQDWENAATQLADGVVGVRDNDIGARGQFLLGQVLETTGRYEEAVEAYDQVQRFKPLYELSYAAQVSAVRVEGIYIDMDEGLRRLRRMNRDDKNYNYRFELAYFQGLIYQKNGIFDDAFVIYDDLLYFEEGNISTVRGRLHYALGELYRDAYRDFVLASAHFDTAKTAIRSPTAAPPGASRTTSSAQQTVYTPEAITDSEEQSEVFGNFVEVHDEIARMDSLLYLGQLDEEAFLDAIYDMRVQLAEELAEQQRLLEEQQSIQRFQATANTGTGNRTSGASASSQASSTTGFLFHKDPIRVQEGRDNFTLRWGERPLVPNWRRQDAISNIDVAALDEDTAQGDSSQEDNAATDENNLPMIDYSNVPRDSLSQAEMRAQRAMARYEMANVLFLSMNRPDSAAVWYRMVIDEDFNQSVAQRSYYALAELQRSLGDTLTSRRLYEQVLADFPDSDFANRVREQLGLEIEEVSDSLTIANEAYDEAYAVWQKGIYEDAFNEMVSVATDYRTTDVAPQALLAAGRVFLEWASRDSLDVFAPLPLDVPDSVLIASKLFKTKEIRPNLETETTSTELPADSVSKSTQISPIDSLGVSDKLAALRGDSSSAVTDTLDVILGPEVTGNADLREPNAEGVTVSPDSLGAVQTPNVPKDSVRLARDVDLDAVNRETRDEGMEPGAAGDTDLQAANADSIAVNPDSSSINTGLASIPIDLLSAGTNSIISVPDTTTADEPSDLMVSIELEPIYLKSLYSSITSHYARSPYAEQAGVMISTLDKLLAEMTATADSMAASGDSMLVTQDSMWVVSDSMLVAQDSIWVASDSMFVAQDSMWVASDSILVARETVFPDSLMLLAEHRAFTDGDSLAVPEANDGQPTTEDQGVEITENFEGEGEDAALRRRNRTDPARPGPQPDSTQTDSGARMPPDFEEGENRTSNEDTPMHPNTPAGRPGAPVEEGSPILGSEPVHPETGGWTLSMNHRADCQMANQMVMGMGYQGFRSALVTYPVGGDEWCRVVVGQFETREEAEAALEEYGNRLPGGLQLFEMKTNEEEE